MTREEAHNLVDYLYDNENSTQQEPTIEEGPQEDATPSRILPEGKRVVRTKTSGDRVYLIDEVKKMRHWITNPDVLKASGFEIEDVVEVEDSELLRYQMGAALYRVDS